jgi:hypothetical protein
MYDSDGLVWEVPSAGTPRRTLERTPENETGPLVIFDDGRNGVGNKLIPPRLIRGKSGCEISQRLSITMDIGRTHRIGTQQRESRTASLSAHQ